MDHFAKFIDKVLTVDMLIDFYHFTGDNLVLTKTKDDGEVIKVTITRESDYYVITDGTQQPLRIPVTVKLPPVLESAIVPVAFKPPLFGGKKASTVFLV